MHTYALGYREPAYVTIMRRYNAQRPKKRFLLLRRFGWKRMSAKGGSASGGKKLLRRHMFKTLNRKYF